jgi:serine/threonine protein kinase
MSTPAEERRLPDWESFYRDYRKPGYVPGFEITTKLGGGMFGLVFRARKQSIGKDYAIKFLQVDDNEVRRALLAELEAVKLFAQIDHPNLVSIEDRGEVDGIPFLVMSFAGTETLQGRIATDGQPPSGDAKRELVHCFLQACRGLAALHERSLVHFDIKPANVFLKGSVARLGDYGLSKLVTHSRGSLSMGRGTPYYMAPEMLQRRGDHRSDIYSLGVMLYEILCGSVPFRGDSEWEVLRKHETATPELPAHLSATERAVLQRCLQKDPAARFQSVHDLVGALTGASSGMVVGASSVHVAPEAREFDASASVPSCLAPEPAAVLPPPRRRSIFGVLLLLALTVGSAVLISINSRYAPVYARSRVSAARAVPQPVAVPAPQPASSLRPRKVVNPTQKLAAQVDQFVAGLQRTVSNAIQRRKSIGLSELRSAVVDLPADFDRYTDLVDTLSRAAVFSAGFAKKLERDGRATFLAGVALLQELDYEDLEDCRRAANVQRFLEQATALTGLEAEQPTCDPTEGDTCRFQAIADGWRKLAEQFARSDADYRNMLVAKGRATAIGGER